MKLNRRRHPLDKLDLMAASARLDTSVGELGQQFRNDVPQGEIGEMGQPHSERADVADVAVPPPFVELPSGSRDVPRFDERVDEPRVDEAPRGNLIVPGAEAQIESSVEPIVEEQMPESVGEMKQGESEMDVDFVDLQALMAVLRREEKEEIQKAEKDIMNVVASIGMNR